MQLDSRLEFVTPSGGLGFALGAAAAGSTTLFPNAIPISNIRNLGVGEPLYVVVTADTDCISSVGSATVTFDLITDDNGALSSPTIVMSSPAFTVTLLTTTTALKARTKLWQARLPDFPRVGSELFLGMQFRVATNPLVAGGYIKAALTPAPSAWQAYADAVN